MNWVNIIVVFVVGFLLWNRFFAAGDDISHVDIETALIIDVRSEREYQGGHISRAINIPVQSLTEEKALSFSSKERPIILYCQSGMRAASAAKALKSWGFSQVYNLSTQSNVQKALSK